MKIIEITEPKALLPPKVEFEDFKAIFRSIRYDGVGLDLEKFKKINEEFGQEG